MVANNSTNYYLPRTLAEVASHEPESLMSPNKKDDFIIGHRAGTVTVCCVVPEKQADAF